MSLSRVLEALPALTFEERQLLIRRVFELDDPPLSEADEALVESRLAAHHLNPTSSCHGHTKKTPPIANEVMNWQVVSRPEAEIACPKVILLFTLRLRRRM